MYEYTSISETRRLRFLRDIFGFSSIEKMQDSAKDPSDKTAEEVVGMLVSRYGIGEYSRYDDHKEETYEVSKADALQPVSYTHLDVYKRQMSCKAAVKGRQKISREEMESLLLQMMELDNPYACPHGRPTMISMTKYELEKKFKRVL